MKTGSSYASQSELPLTFGLGSAGKVDAILVSSGEGLANLLEMLGGQGTQRLAGTALFVPHPRIAEEAARQGLGQALVAGPTDAQMAAALVAYFGGASYN